MMEAKELEWRMYGLVPYNISPIQQGIQYGHAVVEYLMKEDKENSPVRKWAIYDKTFIILNGGTTNNDINSKFYGTMNQHLESLKEANVRTSEFYEPDLGDQLTAIVFLVDERVFDKKKYPEFSDFLLTKIENPKPYKPLIEIYKEEYKEWIELIGGTRNVFLRQFLKQFKLA